MNKVDFKFLDNKGENINAYAWWEENTKIKGIVQIAHGMAESALRYERLAEKLIAKGYKVYANDHRGHGFTAKSLEDVGYISDEDGFLDMIEDMHKLTELIKKENEGMPVFLLGHSMGSFLAQRYIELYPEEVQGLILSGTNGKPKAITAVGMALAKIEMKLRGRKAKSNMLNSLSFGSFNKAFKPNRTDFDWLSRDEKEVDKYIADPYCGGVFTTSFFYDFLKGLREIHIKSNLTNIPKDLPIYIISGEKDPVGDYGKGVLNLVATYKELGIKNLSYKLYKDGRHEILNEISREEVMEDIVYWLEKNTSI